MDVARLTQTTHLQLTDKEKIAALDQRSAHTATGKENRVFANELSTLAQQGVYEGNPPTPALSKIWRHCLVWMSNRKATFLAFRLSPLTMEEATVPEPISMFLADIGREPMPEFNLDLKNWDALNEKVFWYVNIHNGPMKWTTSQHGSLCCQISKNKNTDTTLHNLKK